MAAIKAHMTHSAAHDRSFGEPSSVVLAGSLLPPVNPLFSRVRFETPLGLDISSG
jgi:hypothetical protein